MATDNDVKKRDLTLVSAIGFEGHVPSGLHVHPDGTHVVHALGTSVVVMELSSGRQHFLTGHSHNVSCVDVSRSGKYIASGQINFMGFRAEVIVWSYDGLTRFGSHNLHKVKVEAVAFSANDMFMASLGGQDDGNVIVYDMATKDPLCGLTASQPTQGNSLVLCFCSTADDTFITGGDYTLRVWKINRKRRFITPTNVSVSEVKRKIRCLRVDSLDRYLYCGTTSGDILKVRLGQQEGQVPALVACLARVPEKKTRRTREGEAYTGGVWSLLMLPGDELLVGTGNGTVARLKESAQKPQNTIKLMKRITDRLMDEIQRNTVQGRVTTLTADGQGRVYIGTADSHIYTACPQSIRLTLLRTCHPTEVKEVTFPRACSELFVTCASEDTRIWHAPSGQELMRMAVPNMVCQCVQVTADGSTVITGWNDGNVRGYNPESGKLKFMIRDVHNRGVTALAPFSTGKLLITGGGEGQVRAWEIGRHTQTLRAALKEHRGSVTCLRLTRDDAECVSASTDGSCIIWDVRRFTRKTVLFANTLFMSVCYHPSEAQLITCGTDRKLAYWEIFDGSLIRELEAAQDGALNALDITSDGKYIVTGGDDKLLKVYRYSEGDCVFTGVGHSTAISSLKISPDMKTVVSVGTDGAILCWKMPEDAAVGQ
ncbi:cilia- and flagella-associated protein 52-like [Amphibalanus amphitrite]|uniref:cilia- and flagella-associated protein 52-like n=1 Tax=Amphibalanus amphitrite TaxID=1232801 RepID=UPI001C918BB0|nr:cilia- and flagella-associated protein 52-like [Amphibalanus amphitrite]XP_043195552.1 cilia- and flagella-associated protein 52-like [Amphibalanus amphitrite]XP_043195553.1 cilia- and flagella-associated protein 52-like [Amphibalanus amphitrite]XP_043195554.1 cilia- and flagella-associated protein 52-like [Amphibalanus amphitrite]XP_043195555.1 cilia- and flagella-associated protein 52-like [Amphibalanus amphitrite]XP_043195556.1 cilia- and flagella-associated protein 52-like [Amphibalanus